MTFQRIGHCDGTAAVSRRDAVFVIIGRLAFSAA
jgi:hypothetical protein